MRLLALVLGLCIFTADMLSKWWVKSHFILSGGSDIVNGFFRINYVHNEGIAFGFFHSVNSEWKPVLLGVTAIIALVAVLYYIWTTPPYHRSSFLSLGLLLGGILGNFTDRLVHGYVIDFLELHWKTYFAWPTFNLADAAITFGVIIILYETLFAHQEPTGEMLPERPPSPAANEGDEQSGTLLSVLLIVGLCPLMFSGESFSDSDVLGHIQSRYDRIQNFRADFKQVFHGRDVTLVESGEVWMKKPGKMFWEYRAPQRKYFVADGQKTYFYIPRQKQVMVSRLDLASAHTPLLFLLGRGNLRDEFQARPETTEKPLKSSNLLIRLTPLQPQGQFSYLLLEINPESYLIHRLSVIEPIGNRNDYILNNFQANVKVSGKRFHLKIPADVEVIQQ